MAQNHRFFAAVEFRNYLFSLRLNAKTQAKAYATKRIAALVYSIRIELER
jgi:hypothetical protein